MELVTTNYGKLYSTVSVCVCICNRPSSVSLAYFFQCKLALKRRTKWCSEHLLMMQCTKKAKITRHSPLLFETSLTCKYLFQSVMYYFLLFFVIIILLLFKLMRLVFWFLLFFKLDFVDAINIWLFNVLKSKKNSCKKRLSAS